MPFGGGMKVELIEKLSREPAVCVIVTVMIFLFCYCTDLLLGSLLKMHRSRSALKKLKKQYSLRQRLGLCHFRDRCLHAVPFCRGMVLFLRLGWVIMGVYLLCALAYAFGGCSAVSLAWCSAGILLGFCMPTWAVNLALARPLFGRFREFSFEKYHNTDNRHSLL